jgi:hydrogenase maturation factor
LLCQAFGLDPLGTIASGALLAAVPATHVERAIGACAAVGIACSCIGMAVADATALVLQTGTQTRSLPTFTRDELLTLFQ